MDKRWVKCNRCDKVAYVIFFRQRSHSMTVFGYRYCEACKIIIRITPVVPKLEDQFIKRGKKDEIAD